MEEAQQILDDLLEEVKEYKSLNKSYLKITSYAESYQDISQGHLDSIDALIKKLSLTTEKIESKADQLLNAIDNNQEDLSKLNTSYINIASTIKDTYESNLDNFKSKLDSINTRFNESHEEMQVSLQAMISKFQKDIDNDNKKLYKSIQDEVNKLTDLYKQELHQINTKINSEIAKNFSDLQSRLNNTLNKQQITYRKYFLIGFSILTISMVIILIKLFS